MIDKRAYPFLLFLKIISKGEIDENYRLITYDKTEYARLSGHTKTNF